MIMNQNCNCYEWCQRGSCWTWRSPHHRTRVPHRFSPGHRFTPHLSRAMASEWKWQYCILKANVAQISLFFKSRLKIDTNLCFSTRKEYFQLIDRSLLFSFYFQTACTLIENGGAIDCIFLKILIVRMIALNHIVFYRLRMKVE